MCRRSALLAFALSLAGGWLLAQVPPEERIPIRDPDRLEALGFSRDATNVYVWSRADSKGRAGLDEKAFAAPEWGTRTGYSTVLGSELQQGYADMKLSRYLDHGTYCHGNLDSAWAWAQIQVPDGAKLGFLRFWAYDVADPEDLLFDVYETCQSAGGGPPTNTLIGQAQTFLAIGEYGAFTSLDDLAVDNRDCAYTVRVQFAPASESCIGLSLAVRKLQLTWVRQVSPAPATATFGDVPTDHPFFQFVEALAKSEITGGCGNGNYCPDQLLTRGQMAVFLAKALGLQWP